ncbi:MAG: hypothetical protein WCG44_00320 [bacterium]
MISASILQTLTYSDYFGFPLTEAEIYTRLISPQVLAKDRSELLHKFGSLSGLQQAIKKLISQNKIGKSGQYYYLKGRSMLVTQRRSRERLSIAKLALAKSLALRLSHVPSVLAIYLTGSLAMLNSGGESDIDFMIITKSHRLWTTRILLTIYTELLGLRRRPKDQHSSGKICLNLYLTPTSYVLPPAKQSLFTAYELVQAVPLFDPHATRPALLGANSWIDKYLPNFPLPAAQRSDLVGCKSDQKPTRSDLVGIIEKICYHLQLCYMQGKLTQEYITPDSAFFHPSNPGDEVLKKLQV